ncbi:transposase [Streptomyces sp. NPDC059629]|uniref:IS110 family transposase n=1 Tax=Streptomyces sp. NPDC059629 TaxID=3346889 RepID=UPI00367B7557
MPQLWAGVDIGKEHHHCVVVDERGERVLARLVLNDEPALLELIAEVLAVSEDALWAVDINHGGAALLIGLLLSHEQPSSSSTRPGGPACTRKRPGRRSTRTSAKGTPGRHRAIFRAG